VLTEGIINQLVDHCFDKDDSVRTSISRSLQNIGAQLPELVLSLCASYVVRNGKENKV